MSIQIKRGLAKNLPVLKEGELGFTTDSYEVYIGSDKGNVLLNNGGIIIRANNGMLQYAHANRKNLWYDICSLDEVGGGGSVDLTDYYTKEEVNRIFDTLQEMLESHLSSMGHINTLLADLIGESERGVTKHE